MQNNYYFLRQLSKQLETKLVGLQLMVCFSQEKDELVLGFAAARGTKRNYKEFFIKAVVYPDFSCLYFPEKFERARKNSADLFTQIIDSEVISVHQLLNERCFVINFEHDFSLLFKLYSNRANVVLCQNNAVVDTFHSRILADNQLQISQLDRPINQTFEAFLHENQAYKKLFPTFGKLLNQLLEKEIKEQDSAEQKWNFLQNILQKLENPSYYLSQINGQYHLSLFPLGNILQTFDKPIEALNNFYIAHTKFSVLEKEKEAILRKLNKEKRQTESYLEASYERLAKAAEGVKNEEIGHILMANLHQIPEKLTSIELFDFYRNHTIEIKLKPDLSPQRNAENYYRKSKNEKIDVEKTSENIKNRENLCTIINNNIRTIESISGLKDLRNFLKINKLQEVSKEQKPKELFKKFSCDGFEIWVGKNAKNNDLLTQQYAYKEDLWLHARDVQGSHVVVKFRAGKTFPAAVIERAASLAAYFSKRRNESHVPVIVTQKKFVRKSKGSADGMVVVEKEEVVMVEPKL